MVIAPDPPAHLDSMIGIADPRIREVTFLIVILISGWSSSYSRRRKKKSKKEGSKKDRDGGKGNRKEKDSKHSKKKRRSRSSSSSSSSSSDSSSSSGSASNHHKAEKHKKKKDTTKKSKKKERAKEKKVKSKNKAATEGGNHGAHGHHHHHHHHKSVATSGLNILSLVESSLSVAAAAGHAPSAATAHKDTTSHNGNGHSATITAELKKVLPASGSQQHPQHGAHEVRQAKAPMTREQYEAEQSVVREVFDPMTGRMRLVKGSGEIIERIVSKDEHKRINRLATRGDGSFYDAHLQRMAGGGMN
ncbi:hypothetical protein HK102_008088 [Quaeritorhiza haematococci]|nr:hypothetical protein HK102_008088 [Quaeritorhiza haematococci]